MAFLALLLFAALGYALWSGKIRLAQLPPILLTLGGAMIAIRGGWIIGVPAMIAGVTWYRGLTWRLFGTKAVQTDEFDLSTARWLLGVSALDDAERIRARHRQLIAQNHPDTGGSEERAMELNKARDVLLDDLARKSR
jgi:hypothetical protein